jgi:hypothetical protein
MQMENHFAKGPRSMEITMEGKRVSMNYSTQHMWDLVPMYGERVLRIPEECVNLLSFQKTLLHMEGDWVKMAEWPFVALSSSTTTAVVPFDDLDQDGIMPELVRIIPRGFFTASLILDLDMELNDHFFGGGQFL